MTSLWKIHSRFAFMSLSWQRLSSDSDMLHVVSFMFTASSGRSVNSVMSWDQQNSDQWDQWWAGSGNTRNNSWHGGGSWSSGWQTRLQLPLVISTEAWISRCSWSLRFEVSFQDPSYSLRSRQILRSSFPDKQVHLSWLMLAFDCTWQLERLIACCLHEIVMHISFMQLLSSSLGPIF